MEVLFLVEERGGPEMMARIGMMQALNRHSEKRCQRRGGWAKAFQIIR